MYQYYNYLIFEKNKEHFNDINPDLRKMTYKYDEEVKNAYMTVQASPEVIKAAMGMNIQSKADLEKVKGKKLNFDSEEKKQSSPVAPAPNDEKTPNDGKDLSLKKIQSQGKKTLRYTKDQILQIYKGLGNFKSPLANPDKFEVRAENLKYLNLLLNSEPNVVLQTMKDLPALQAHQGNKVKIVDSIIDRNLDQIEK